MIKKIAIAIGVVVAAVLLYAATRPGTLHVERSATINAAPEQIYPHINDLHRWSDWSPYEKIDPTLKRTFSGSPEGKGAIYELTWE